MSILGIDEVRPPQTCDNCGAVFQVNVPKKDSYNEDEEYYCPECVKEFFAKASSSPEVKLITPRTDGKTERFKNLPHDED